MTMAARLTAHPRLRGEHGIGRTIRVTGRGSSPLTRGARKVDVAETGGDGLIPAYAGSTQAVDRRVNVHRGSSPLTRGAPCHARRGRGCQGLIPAYAGSTRWRIPGGWLRRAHPRLRGEHSWAALSWWAARGSSPLTRGALRLRWGGSGFRGLIPAYAGSTVLNVVHD